MATKTLMTADEFYRSGPETDGYERVRGQPDAYLCEARDLAVEVRSADHTWRDTLIRVGEHFRIGVRLVWVIDKSRRRLTVFSADDEPMTLTAENELAGGTVLPGFRCRVAEFFE